MVRRRQLIESPPDEMWSDAAKNDLHGAMIAYCEGAGMTASASALRLETRFGDDPVPDSAKQSLERKWTAVLRLTKRTKDLEEELARTKLDMHSADKVARGVEVVTTDFLPRSPPAATLTAHRKSIACLVLHPRFNVCVTAGEDAAIKSWDLDTGSLEKTLSGHTGAVNGLAFNESGTHLASASNDMSVKLWDFGSARSTPLARGEVAVSSPLRARGAGSSPLSPLGMARFGCRKTLTGHDHAVSGVAFVHKTAFLLSASRDATIALWDTESGHCVRRFRGGHSDWIRAVSVNFGGNLVVSASSDHSVCVWDFATGNATQKLLGHTNVVECIDISTPEGDKRLRHAIRHKALSGSSSSGDTARAADGAEPVLAAEDASTTPTRTPMKPADSSSSSGNGAITTLPDSRSPTVAKSLFASPGYSSSPALLLSSYAGIGGGGAYVLSGSRDRSMRVWDTATGVTIADFGEHENWVRAVKFHPNGVWALSACEDCVVRVYDVASKSLVKRLPDASRAALTTLALRPATSAGPPLIVTGAADGVLSVWDVR